MGDEERRRFVGGDVGTGQALAVERVAGGERVNDTGGVDHEPARQHVDEQIVEPRVVQSNLLAGTDAAMLDRQVELIVRQRLVVGGEVICLLYTSDAADD